MKKDVLVYIDDILESIALISSYVDGLDFDEFSILTETQDAILRRLEIIGEAAARIPEPIRNSHPEIPWRQIIVLQTSALAFLIVKYVGALYLLYLGIKTLKDRSSLTLSSDHKPRQLRVLFGQGALSNVTNP